MNKTVPSETSVDNFIAVLDDVQQQKDSKTLVEIMQTISGEKPVLWGSSIVGFGTMHYTYATGKEGDWMKIGFSPRKGKLSLYITGDASKYSNELDAMGKHKIGKGCIYISKLADVDIDKLSNIISKAYKSANYF
jgi:hypothetical protein